MDAIATGGDDGRLAVGLVNKSDGRAGGVRIRIGGIPVSGRHRAVVLTGATPDSYNDVQDPDAVRPVETDLEFVDGVAEIPAHSVVVCTIDAAAASDADAFPWGCGPVGTWTKAPNA